MGLGETAKQGLGEAKQGPGEARPKILVCIYIYIYNTVKHHYPMQPPLNVHELIVAGISSAAGVG